VQFRPVLPEIERRIKETASEDVFNWYYRYVEEVPCDACGGARLRPEAFVGGNRWAEHLSSEQYGFQTLFRLA